MLFSGFLLLLFLDFIAIRESWLVGCLFFIASSLFILLTVISQLSEFLNHYFFDWETKMHKGYFYMCFPHHSCFAWSSLRLRVCSCGSDAGCHARGHRSLPWHTEMTWTTVIRANQSCIAPESLPPFLCFGFVLPAFNLRVSNFFFLFHLVSCFSFFFFKDTVTCVLICRFGAPISSGLFSFLSNPRENLP